MLTNDEYVSSTRSTKSPLLSVIIPTCNGARTIGEQLKALANQEYDGEWELLVVDNNSTDNTIEVVRACQERIPHLRIVHATDRQGRSHACNVGAWVAKGDAFVFCDDDDVVGPGWLQAMAEALAAHDLVAGSIEVEQLNQDAAWRPVPPNGSQQRALGFLPYVIGCNMGVSRAAFAAVGGFADDMVQGQDVDLSWRIQLGGYTVHDAPMALVHYRYRKGVWEMFKQTMKYAKAHVLLYKRFAAQGMPRSSVREAFRRYLWLLRQAPAVVLKRGTYEHRMYCIHRTAACLGRIWGSLRYRRLYL